MTSEFRVDDLVEWCGAIGKVVHVYTAKEYRYGYTVRVRFETIDNNAKLIHEETFMHDGRYARWHKEPSLKKIKR